MEEKLFDIDSWKRFHSLISIGLINACQLALILKKMTVNELTPDLKEETIEKVCRLFFDLDNQLYGILERGGRPPEGFPEEILKKLDEVG